MTIPEILYDRAMQAGFTKEAACALLAMVEGESAFRCDNAEDRINRSVSDAEYVRRADAGELTYNGKNFIYDEVGFGYIQWTYWSRKKGLYEFCKNRGVSVADHEAQKEFIFVEMQRDFPAIWNQCRTNHDLAALTKLLIVKWENPADHAGAYAVRYPFARAWYAKFSGWTQPTNEEKDTTVSPEPLPKESKEPSLEVHWPPRTINAGLNWPETYLLQAALRCRGYNVLVNGIFSEELTEKTKDFQKKEGLKEDGVVGPKTWLKLLSMSSF